ncbi:MAG: hypothetical protein L6Q38_16340, partial [Nitrospira sp.]|nr:hypothetical protein [Nitrospira sp.]
LVVGSPDWNSCEGMDCTGSVAVFRGPLSGDHGYWEADGYLVCSGANSVAGLGDVNGDGLADFAVSQEGGTSVFLGPGPTGGVNIESEDARSAVISEFEPAFGFGDPNGDGAGDLLAGRFTHPVTLWNGPFLEDRGSGDYQLRVSYCGHQDGGFRIGGDLLDLGVGTVIIGEPDPVNPEHDTRGVVRVFAADRWGDSWCEDADVTLVGAEVDDFAGASVAARNDVDGDGHADTWVGAPLNAGYGSVYLIYGPLASDAAVLPMEFDLSGSHARFRGFEGAAGDTAYSVGASLGAGDFNADGLGDVVIHAGADLDGSGDVRAFFVFTGRARAMSPP